MCLGTWKRRSHIGLRIRCLLAGLRSMPCADRTGVRVQGCIHTAPRCSYPKRFRTRPKLCMHDECMYGKIWTGFGRLVILY